MPNKSQKLYAKNLVARIYKPMGYCIKIGLARVMTRHVVSIIMLSMINTLCPYSMGADEML